MSQKGKEHLKKLFTKGTLPSESSFKLLIDSMYNLEDDEFEKLLDGPLRLYVRDENGKRSDLEALLEFYNEVPAGDGEKSTWRFSLSEEGKLRIQHDDDKTVIELDREGNVYFDTEKFDVSGNVSFPGIKGSYLSENTKGEPIESPKADGIWHPLIKGVSGCQMFQVVAGAGYPKGVKFALTHAIATLVPKKKNSLFFPRFSPRNTKVTYTQSFSGRTNEKIDFKWTEVDNAYDLEVRTRTDYGAKTIIQCQITQLWFDPFMSGNLSTNK